MTAPTPPIPPPPVPPPPGAVPPAPRSEFPRWVVGLVTLGVVLALCAAGVAVLVGAHYARRSVVLPARPTPEPAHDVVYRFTATGTANENYVIIYTGADGRDRNLSLPGVVPGWRHELRVAEGSSAIVLSVRAYSSDSDFKIRCQIEIDGYVEETGQGVVCNLFVHLPRQDRPRSPAPPPPSATAAPAPLPRSCRYVPPADATQIISQAAGVPKTVLASGDDNGTCYYVFDANTGSVRFTWKRGAKGPRPPNAVRVPGVGGSVYWVDYGDNKGDLEAHLANGIFRVEVFFLALDVDARAAAVEFFQAARRRLG